MGEEETKPKVEHKPKKGHHAQRHYHAKPKFKAPTPGLEDVVLTTGLTKDAVEFEENKKKLGRYMAVTFKSGGATVQMAIETMTTPIFNKPADLTANATRWKKKNGKWRMRNGVEIKWYGKKYSPAHSNFSCNTATKK